MQDVFIPTQNYQRCKEACDEIMTDAHGLEMVVAVGRAGRGKSTAVWKITAQNDAAVLVPYQEWMTPVGLLRELAFHLSGVRPYTMRRVRDSLETELSRRRRLLIVDEADRMSLRHLNALRDLHDEFCCGVVLVGEEPLLTRLAQERRLKSRVRTQVAFSPAEQQDVVAIYRQALHVVLRAEHAQKLTRHSGGDFRIVVRDALEIERMMRVSAIPEITDGIVAEVCSNGV
jgi:DNA transposition AAA+ family ATPase